MVEKDKHFPIVNIAISLNVVVSSGESKGASGTLSLPLGPFFFNFIQFSVKIWQNKRLISTQV